MITEYGKILRHIRLDIGELLGTMAEKLDLSAAYLSSIENGTRSIPVNLTTKIIEIYKLNSEEQEKIIQAEAETNKSLTIDLSNASIEQVETTAMFAREIKNLSVSELRALYETLKKKREDK